MDAFTSIMGVIGSIIVVVLYWAITTQRMKPTDPRYLWINLVAAGLLGSSLIYHPNIGSITIEVFWSLISIKSLYHHYRNTSYE